MALSAILNPVLSPLKSLPPLLAVLIISILVAVIITLIYKFTTDQTKMKDLKETQKKYQKKMKELRSDPDKLMKMQKKAMESNMQYMKHTMVPMLITMLPIFIIFGWMNANMAFSPILPGQEFTMTVEMNKGYTGDISVMTPDEIEVLSDTVQEISDGRAHFTFKGETGDYLVVYDYEGERFDKEITISEDNYADAIKQYKSRPVKSISSGNEKLIVLNLFGWKLGWLGAYIIFSIIFSTTLRKLLKVY